MIKSKDMAAQLRGVNYVGPGAEHVHQIVSWLEMQGDVFIGSDLAIYLQKILGEMHDGEIIQDTVEYKYEPEHKVATLEELDYAEREAEEPEDPDEYPELQVVKNEGLGAFQSISEGDYRGAFDAGYHLSGADRWWWDQAERAEEVLRIRDKNRQQDYESVAKIVRAAHDLGFSQREIAKRLDISRSTVSRILKGTWKKIK